MTPCIVCRAFQAGVGPEVVLHRREAQPLCTTHRLSRGRFLAWTKPRIGTPEGDALVTEQLLAAARIEVAKNLTPEEREAVSVAAGIPEPELARWAEGATIPPPVGRRILEALRQLA